MDPARSIVTGSKIDAVLEGIFGSNELADMAMGGFWFILGKNPESGTRLSPRIWIISMDGSGVWKNLDLYYHFDDKQVVVLRVEEVKRG